jgi:hypothetical protein
MSNVIWLVLTAMALWYWWDSLRSKETARRAGRNACQRAGVQFLDDTVVRRKIWLARGASGRMQVCRRYHFEFASDGEYRYGGQISLQGQQVREVIMDAYRV